MSTESIIFNYQESIRQAERLEETAKKLDRIADNRMKDTENSLRAVWDSDNSEMYYKKFEIVADQIKNDAKNLRSAATTIRNIAESIKQAELEAERIARERAYREQQEEQARQREAQIRNT